MFNVAEAERFIVNAQQYAKITNEKLPPGLSADEVIGRIKANVAICRKLMTDNNEFINTYYLLSGSLYSDDSVNATRKAMELVNECGGYFQLKDRNTRLCAAACYNQLAISTYNSRNMGYREKFRAIDDALAFYRRDAVRSLDLDFPWQSWIDDVNGNIYYMGIQYEFMTSIDPIEPDLAERVYNFNRSYFTPFELIQLNSKIDFFCSNFIKDSIHTTDSEKWIQCIQYIIPAYHSGHIDTQRYVKMLQFCLDAHKAFLSTSPDFLTEYVRFDMIMVISAILTRYTKDHNIGVYLFDYLHKLPREILDALPSSKEELKTVADNTLDADNRQSYIDILLKSTTHNHLPTYVHSMMVSHLMACFVSWFLENKPEMLKCKTGNTVMDEIINQSPGRYAPEIAHALHDEKLRESINNILQNVRLECCYKAYCEFSQS